MHFPLLAIFFLYSSCLLSAQPTADTSNGFGPILKAPLRVGVTEAPPYLMKNSSGDWTGMSITLWRQVAEALHVSYDLVEVKQPDDLLVALKDTSLDVSLYAALEAEQYDQVDFAPAYNQTTIGIAVPKKAKLWQLVKALFTARFLKIVGWLSVVLLVVGVIIWLLERKSNEDDFGDRSVLRGIGSGFWWAGVTLTTIGYGDKAPRTIAGRIVAMLWMLVAIGISATLTASIVSILGTKNSINFPNELKDSTVGVLKDSPVISFLDQQGIAYQSYTSVVKGLEAVQAKELKAFVHSATALKYIVKDNKHLQVSVQTTEAQPHAYTFAFPIEGAWKKPVSRAVLQKIMRQEWLETVTSYQQESD